MTPEEQAAADKAAADKAAADKAANETWQTKLPDDLKSNETLAQFKNDENMIPMPISMAKSYAHVRTMVGADTLKIPKTDEDWEDVYTKLGRPDTADLYLLQQAEDVSPDLQESIAKDAEWFRATAHKLGLNDIQTTSLFREFTKQMSDKYTEMQNLSKTEGINTEIQLRTEYGTAYEGNKILMDRALKELGGSEFVELLNTSGVGKHPAFMRAMFKVGGMMAEDLGLDKSTGQLIKSKSTVEEEIAHLQAKPAYIDGTHPEHKALVAKVLELNKQIYGSEVIPSSVGISGSRDSSFGGIIANTSISFATMISMFSPTLISPTFITWFISKSDTSTTICSGTSEGKQLISKVKRFCVKIPPS